VNDWARLAVGVVVLSGLTVAVLFGAKVPHGRAVVVATLRAALQLAIVARALRGVFAAPIAVIGAATLVAYQLAAPSVFPQPDA
jgi:ABC-type iron transport system FetAB permease component